MNPKYTWNWLIVAAGLFAFIFFFERHLRPPATGPALVLPALRASAVTSIQVRLAGQPEIRVERANNTWQITSPIVYPAQAASVESLLAALEHLLPAKYITAAELKGRPKADEEFGFNNHQASLILQQDDYKGQLLIGARTPPGDQVYVRVAGRPDICVVDAELLKLLPRSTTDWRGTSLVDLPDGSFDRLVVTASGAKALELQRDASNKLWRMTHTLQARANNTRIAEALRQLQSLRVLQFVTDDPKADLEAFGLKPASLELALWRGSNIVAQLQFGKSLTNDATRVYARGQGTNAIVAVSGEPLKPWRGQVNDFRDPHLVTLTARVDEVEVRGEDDFTLQRQPSNTWRIASRIFPVDTALAEEFVGDLSTMQIVQFVIDTATEADLQAKGLAAPARQFTLKSASAGGAGVTNAIIAQLIFGAAQEDKVFVRRADEDFIYAVRLDDFKRLPSASWQLRERRVWNFTEDDVARLTVSQGGKTWQVTRTGSGRWSLAGSQGVIDDVATAALEEVAHRLGELTAITWADCGDQNLARYGFNPDGYKITVELKSGGKLDVEFGGMSSAQNPYGKVALDGQAWIFEFSPALYLFARNYLKIPANVP